MNIEEMREEFEAFAAGHSSLSQYGFDKYPVGGDGYDAISLQCAWEAWQASRESLVIELPAEDPLGKGPGDCEGSLPSFEQHCAAECNFILRDCREAIHATGVKTK